MTPIDALFELFDRVGAYQGVAVLVNAEELHQWPSAAVKAMKSHRLIVKAPPGSSAICPGCERNCVMPVHILPATAGAPASFIVCDKRSDINRVSISSERLIQWQCNPDLVSKFIATSLGLRLSSRHLDNTRRWEIGMASGDKRSQMLCLEVDGTLNLVAANNKVPLSDVVVFQDGQYILDRAMIRRIVDAATTADDRYTPSDDKRETRKVNTQAMYEIWGKAYRELRKKRPGMSGVWYSRQIAKMDIARDHSAETIRKRMKK